MARRLKTGLGLSRGRVLGGVITTAITLTRDVVAWGASTIAGKQDATAVTITQDAALQIDAAAVTSTETVNSVNYEIQTVSNGRALRNRGVGGQNAVQIRTRTAFDAAGLGATDFAVLAIGDNGVSAGDLAGITYIYDQMVLMASDVGIGSRPFLKAVNTRGGYASSSRLSVSEAPGTYWYALKENLFRRYQADNPGKALDIFWTLLDHAPDFGLQTGDQADIDRAISPVSFMKSDGSHMGQTGCQVISRSALVPALDAVEGGTPFGFRQQIAPAAPATPAAGDVIGTVGFFGSGGSLALDASNTQTDYAVASNGQITRIGATPPTRDLIKVPIQFSKTGRNPRTQPNVWVGERAKPSESRLVQFDGYSMIINHASRWSNAAKLLVVFRLQGATGQDGVLNNVFGGGSSTSLIRRLSGNSLDVVWRNSAGSSILSCTTGNNLFRVADTARWVAISIDVPASTARVVHWTATNASTTVANGGSAQTTLAADTGQLIRLNTPFGFGANAGLSFSQLGTAIGSFRIGDFWMCNDYRDMTVQANRELFSLADGTGPNATLVASSDGVVDGMTPLLYCRGNATDWRMCNFIGANNEMSFHHWKRAADADRGYLTTI